MRLGLSSYTYTWAVGVPGHAPPRPLSAGDLVRRAAEKGVACVQVADNVLLEALTDRERRDLRTLAMELGVAIEVGARSLTPESLARHLEIAAFFHSPVLRFVIDGPGYEPTVDAVVAVVTEALPRLRETGVRLAIENHDRLKAAQFREIVLRTDPEQVGICLDSVNSMGAGEGVAEVVATLAPSTLNLHLKDFTVARVSYKMGFVVEGRPAGQGMLNISWLLEEMRRHGRCQSAILELWTPPADTIEETIAREAAWADESLRFLKPLFA
ncbi:MAG TPA: TIM barrel protein [Vicinamibacteria bacterium]